MFHHEATIEHFDFSPLMLHDRIDHSRSSKPRRISYRWLTFKPKPDNGNHEDFLPKSSSMRAHPANTLRALQPIARITRISPNDLSNFRRSAFQSYYRKAVALMARYRRSDTFRIDRDLDRPAGAKMAKRSVGEINEVARGEVPRRRGGRSMLHRHNSVS
jgi:hypothetical protein